MDDFIQSLIQERGRKCEVCGGIDVILDKHEGIVSKGDVQGWPKKRRILIMHPYNCFIVCRDKCHKHDRDSFWELSCKRYGEQAVREWYENLPWKLKKVPRRFWDESV